ncbi:unnamed protein product [Cunninghamella blakesleeana]
MTDYSYDTFLNPLDALAFDIAQTTTETDQQNAAAELALWTNAQFTFDVKPGSGIFDDEKSSICSPTIQSPKSESVNPLETTINNNNKQSSIKNDDNDPITYEKLVNYLDFELPQQQKKQHEQKQQQQYQEQKFNPEGLVNSFNSQQKSFPSTPISTVPNSPTLVPTTATTSASSSPSISHLAMNSSISQQQPVNVVGGRQILPKPVMINPLDLASLLIAPLQFNNNHVTSATTGLNLNSLTSPILTPTINLTAKKPRKKSTTPTSVTAGVKRDRDDTLTEEEKVAEEDKRRRNTAASARFRIKKKLREQAMEQSVRDMTQKSEKLQERVNELELEIKLLRSLLTEKEMTTINSSA